MKQLTFEGNFCDIARCKEVKCPYDTDCSQKQIWERLKRYEDTKRTPEQIEALEAAIMGKAVAQITEFEGLPIARLRELAVADQEGRVTILPCRGDADIVLMQNGVDFKPDHWNILLTTFAENQPTPSGKKVALFDLSEVLELMEGKKDG